MGEIIEQQRARAARMDNPSRKQVPQDVKALARISHR